MKLAKQVLVVREKGRCYCCGLPAHDLAHLKGRSNLMTAFETHEEGNCHMLCSDCHRKDHDGNLMPSYEDMFIGKNGINVYLDLVRRSKRMPISTSTFLELEEERLNEELQRISEG